MKHTLVDARTLREWVETYCKPSTRFRIPTATLYRLIESDCDKRGWITNRRAFGMALRAAGIRTIKSNGRMLAFAECPRLAPPEAPEPKPIIWE